MKRLLAVDIGGTGVKWACMTDAFVILERGTMPTSFVSADEVVEALVGLSALLAEDVDGIAISVPGGVSEGDADCVIERGGSLPYLDGCPLGRLLRARMRVPVVANNDGRCCALGEYAAGALRGTRIGVVLALGTGVGGGIVMDGRVLQGAHGYAGEFSFLNNRACEPFGRSTAFGVTGGWEELRRAVFAEKGLPVDTRVDGRTLFRWMDEGDVCALAGLSVYARGLAGWMLNLQAILDPEVMVIAGGISAASRLVAQIEVELDAAYARYTTPFAGLPRPQVRSARLGNDANLYGAVQTFLNAQGACR